MLIILDAGHGGRDPGGGTCNLFREADWALAASLHQAELLRAVGHTVVLTRTADITLPPPERARIVREAGESWRPAAICLSNHINNVSNPAARGLEIFHSIHSKPDLAQAIADEILALRLIGPRSGGLAVVRSRRSTKLPDRDFYYMHRLTGNVRTLIIEYGFASNPQDAQILYAHRDRLAEAAVRGLLKHLAGRNMHVRA